MSAVCVNHPLTPTVVGDSKASQDELQVSRKAVEMARLALLPSPAHSLVHYVPTPSSSQLDERT